MRKRSKCSIESRNIACTRVQANKSCDPDSKVPPSMSPENLTHLIRDSHFNSAITSMTPLTKSYLHTYLNNTTNVTVISEFVESVLAVTQTEKGRKLAQTTLAHLEVVTGAVNSLRDQTTRAKHDLYLLVLHPNGGNTLFNDFHKEESSRQYQCPPRPWDC